jgi:hypothetical protein
VQRVGKRPRTDKLTNGDLLRKGTLGADPVLPAIVHGLTDPEELSEEKEDGGDERAGQAHQSATHDGTGVDADDGEEDGEASGPYDGIEAGRYEVVRCDAVEPGKVRGVFHVHEHAGNLYDQTKRKGCKWRGECSQRGGRYQSKERKAHASSHQ